VGYANTSTFHADKSMAASPDPITIQLEHPGNRAMVKRFLAAAYQEWFPQQHTAPVTGIVNDLWHSAAPVWVGYQAEQAIACLWLGRAIDTVSGQTYTQIYLVYVCPNYRRQGIGTELLKQAEAWAIAKGDPQLGLHVFCQNVVACRFYEGLGFQPQAILLAKSLEP
jgi:GNAT superfamily N-acetyltransferase